MHARYSYAKMILLRCPAVGVVIPESFEGYLLVLIKSSFYQFIVDWRIEQRHPESTKCVIMIELTSPVEENMEKWREIKKTKYEKLAEQIREGGIWTPWVFTIEVGAIGYVARRTQGLWRKLGIGDKEGRQLSKKLSRSALRSSHFICGSVGLFLFQ